jgi:hypothetical protein
MKQDRLGAVGGKALRETDAAAICLRSGKTIQTLRRCAMTVRNVVECTLAIVALLVLALIGWQTYAVNGDVANLKHDMLTQQDMAEAVKAVAASKELGGNRPLVSLASNVIPAPPEASEKPAAGPAVKGVDADVPAQLKTLGDDLQKTKKELAEAKAAAGSYITELAEVKAKLEANIEATQIARLDLGRIVKKDTAGNPIVAIREMTQNAEFKDEFRKAVNEALERPAPSSGKIRLDNRMPDWEFLEVDGIGHWVGPSSYLDVVVSTGAATTRLPGYEPAKSWTLDSQNNYFQSVVIQPLPAVIANP